MFHTWNEGFQTYPDLPEDSENGVAYRNRREDEVEAIQLSGRVAQARLKSIDNRGSIEVYFFNITSCDVQLVWLNYKGDEVAYGRISAHRSVRLFTYKTHPWIFREVVTKERMNWNMQQVMYCVHAPLLNPRRSGMPHFVIITEPPLVTWSERSHKVFPVGFKRTAAALLLCHRAWRKHYEALRQGRRGLKGATLGDLPIDLIVFILKLAAPAVMQQMACPYKEGRMDLQPVTVPCTEEEVESMIGSGTGLQRDDGASGSQ